MAKKSTSKSGNSKDETPELTETDLQNATSETPVEDVVDAVEDAIEAEAAETDAEPEAGAPEEGAVEEADPEVTEDDDNDEPQSNEDPIEAEEPAPVVVNEPAPQPKKSSPMPLVFGGLVAGAIGFGAAQFAPQLLGQEDTALDAFKTETQQVLDAQNSQLNDLSEQVAAATFASNATGDLTARMDEVNNDISSINNRLADFEKKLIQQQETAAESNTGAASPELLAELEALQAMLGTQQEQIAAMQAEAEANKARAQSAAEGTLRRAAMARIQTALDSGGPFADALVEMERLGIAVPEALVTHASAGVSSVTELTNSFPDAARAALNAARAASSESGEGGGITSTLRGLLGARSLEPREGDDPDAVLSRMEAAALEGRLSDALAEMDILPEVALNELAAWKIAVENRLSAVSAAQALGDTLN